jgi:hypothetical protein
MAIQFKGKKLNNRGIQFQKTSHPLSPGRPALLLCHSFRLGWVVVVLVVMFLVSISISLSLHLKLFRIK